MPTARERTALWGRTIFRVLGQNRVSQAGVIVTTATGISMVFLWIMEILRGGTSTRTRESCFSSSCRPCSSRAFS
jgi:hypothetical protein